MQSRFQSDVDLVYYIFKSLCAVLKLLNLFIGKCGIDFLFVDKESIENFFNLLLQ